GSPGTPAGGPTIGAGAPIAPASLTGPPTPSILNPATSAPARPRSRKPAAFSLRVRFDGAPKTLERLAALPDAENPAIIYLGVLQNSKTAVFLLDSSVEAQGDGKCNPSPSDCQRLYMREGDTEFLDVAGENGAQYQIDLLDIRSKPADSTEEETAAVSAKGRRALRARMSRVGRLRYDARTGRLRYLSMRAWREQVKRSR
ncbi:MAG: hypothetical protein M3P50_13420, partial [Actinomycetota bacterium]|nr:hypothetical protein [Actinomycetota bacterium]